MRLGLAVVLILGVAACGAGTDDDPTGRTWNLTELEGGALVEGTTIDMTITDEGVSGSSGCNSYSGAASVDVEAGTMTLGPQLASTMMACEEPIMDQEQRYLDALVRVVGYEMAPDELVLLDEQGIAVATFN